MVFILNKESPTKKKNREEKKDERMDKK